MDSVAHRDALRPRWRLRSIERGERIICEWYEAVCLGQDISDGQRQLLWPQAVAALERADPEAHRAMCESERLWELEKEVMGHVAY